MADANLEGHLAIILEIFERAAWKELWQGLNVQVVSFEALGLPRNLPDDILWRILQKRDVILFTGNRNKHGPNSLEEAIRDGNTSASPPVITLANPGRFIADRRYAERTAEKLIERLCEIEYLRGVGRIYIP
jgi:hypothetical protein